MSGNLLFTKTSGYFYNLVYDFQPLLASGEVIKQVSVFVNDEPITTPYDIRFSGYINNSGTDNSIFAIDCALFDYDTITIKVNSGVLNSGYAVKVDTLTNRRNAISRTIDVFVDDISYPNSKDEFNYRFLPDGYNIYILPALEYMDKPGLDYNTEYTVYVNKDITSIHGLQMIQDYSFWFTSQYCPMFTTAHRMIMMLGIEGEKFLEDTINRYILRTSMEAIDFMNMSPDCNSGYHLAYDYYGCGPDGIPPNLRRYVECKVAYDLFNLLNRMRIINGTAGGQTKTLGDMTIKYGSTLNAYNKNAQPNPLQDYYNCFMRLMGILSNSPTLCGTGAGINNGVRGLYDVSKGFEHPTFDVEHNRIQKPKPPADGPWFNSTNYRYPMSYTPPKPSRRDIF